MGKINSVSQTKTTNNKPGAREIRLGVNHLITFGAAFMGVAVGVIASLAMVLPMVKAQLTAQNVAMAPVSTKVDACVVPTSASTPSTGHVLGENSEAAKPTYPGGQGGGSTEPEQTTVFVKKFVGGIFAKSTGTIDKTGPDSTNVVKNINKAETTITNNNEVTVTSNNTQSSSTGNATVQNNTTAGSATTGNATNTNKTELNLSITN